MLVLARMIELRGGGRWFAPADLNREFEEAALPIPANTSAVLRTMAKAGNVTNPRSGVWSLTPQGRAQSGKLASDLDLAAFAAEGHVATAPQLGHTSHPVVPPHLAPPELLGPLHRFQEVHPFETNVFAMTRFPDEDDADEGPDPVGPALDAARDACATHGLTMHLASTKAIHDDLWTNVAGHMWGCQYGIAFFEDRREKGLNYNLTIEVGAMLMAGRRCALLKDASIARMPTDLVGRIYKSIDLDDPATVTAAVHVWAAEDLGLGHCARCPPVGG